MRYSYHCPYCDQRSTRRWNLDVHIKRKHGGYLLGRSGTYMTNNPIFDRKGVQFGHATIADNVWPRYSTSIPQYSPCPIYPPWQVMDDEINQNSLSQEKMLKIEELKRLMYKYPQYHINPDDIIRVAIFNSINRDDRLLDGKLQQLRNMDIRLNGRASPFTLF
jgi:hypothetical protein